MAFIDSSEFMHTVIHFLYVYSNRVTHGYMDAHTQAKAKFHFPTHRQRLSFILPQFFCENFLALCALACSLSVALTENSVANFCKRSQLD